MATYMVPEQDKTQLRPIGQDFVDIGHLGQNPHIAFAEDCPICGANQTTCIGEGHGNSTKEAAPPAGA